jgi:ABC-type hemin transport system substrate-binding protein
MHTLDFKGQSRFAWMHAALAMLICLALIGGCSKSSPSASSSQTTASGAQTTDSDIESRFVVLSPAIGVMLRDIGFEDSIVGRHSYDTALSKSIPVVGSHVDIDYELLITLEPTDLFFERNSVGIPERAIALAKEHGWHIWTYELNTLDDIALAVDDLYLKLVGFQEKKTSDDNFLNIDIDPTAKFDIELPSARLAKSWSPIGRAAAGAGRVLILGSVDPPGAMGPGSFHAQLVGRLGVTSAIADGGMWQELDYEDIIGLAPDSILVFIPKAPGPSDLIGEPVEMTWEQIQAKVGGIASLPIPASEHQRIGVIEHPLGLMPSTSLGQVADEIAAAIRGWDE